MHPNLGNPTVVLVHGAWADGSSWSRVITQLEQSGIPVTAAPIPLTSLDDDVDAVIRTIDRTEGPIVLAGHAYAGGVIGATGHPRIRALVYVAALAPDEGETVADVFYRDPPHPRAPELKPDNDGWIWLPTNAFGAAFAQHATAQEHALLAAVQRPITVGSIQKPVPRPGWKDIPTWFLIAEEDRMINPDTQRFMAERTHARIHTHGVDHTPSITRPEVVTAILTEAVESIGV
ncbi:alpha/beta hydrolase [Mycobacterium heidelbergense]|uniref:Alpha/beta hydrolase n=1 Tax=Mycobacterium heidelbergense TaxID=53376 RepID=A0A1X0DN10_MYCHE|nr:alpha/beta hydrolase [Mycobacterium heidelbergense]MCV7051235.1 alpha/beta hydrolase [Mycobacterium heidelbergense]ORA73230.1 alpha/beta hydrolase [Mycobacterium heidelbergense]BBZ52032.1 alpha/beta hydrolase [Mycobacterium heidelbergense]